MKKTALRSSCLVLSLLLLLCSCCCRSVMCFRKFETAGSVPKRFFEEEKSIYAFVERVIDGDTIRVRHVPLYHLQKWFKKQSPLTSRGIADQTLSIRIYGVDCPELAKRKSQTSQPYAETAKQFTTNLVWHKMVRITFLKRDQYQRAVCVVQTLPKLPFFVHWIPGLKARDLSVELASHGLAELYTAGGAVYWNRRPLLEKRIQRAQQQRWGIWSLGSNRESAEQHKKKLQKATQGAAALTDTTNRKFMAKTTTKTNRPTNHTTDQRKKNVQAVRSCMLDVAITGLEVLGT